MTSPPEPDLTAPRDPAEYSPRLFGPGFWVAIAFGVVCVAAGAGVTAFGPTLFPPRPKPAADVPPPPPAAPEAPAPAAALPAAPAPTPEPQDVSGLTRRLEALEAQQTRTAGAASATLAAAALMEAADSSRPFSDELAALQALTPPSADLRALQAAARTGAPSRASLAVEFPDYAARAAVAARGYGGATVWDRIRAAVARVVAIRRIGEAAVTGPDAVLAQAETQLGDGDVDLALRTLDRLPPASREALGPWLARAQRRAEVDRRIAAVRAQALDDLARARNGP